MTVQTIPPQSQPVDEQSGATLDRTWYRFLSSLFTNLSDVSTSNSNLNTTVTNLSTNITSLTSIVNSLPRNPLVFVGAPPHNTSPGSAGQVAFDSGFFYVCIAANSWARVAIGGAW